MHGPSYNGLEYSEEFYRARKARSCARLLDLLAIHHPDHCRSVAVERANDAAGIKSQKKKAEAIPLPEEIEEIKIASWVAEQFAQPKKLRPWNDSSRMRIDKIQSLVCLTFGVVRSDMLSKRRTRDLAVPRHIAAYLARKLTAKSLPQIGAAFGGRDHTTILNSMRWIESHKPANPKLAAQIDALETALSESL